MRARVGVITIVVLLALALLTGVLFMRRGSSTRDAPSMLETALATQLRRMSVPASAKDSVNPVPFTPEVVAEARAHFATHCATCHGNDGSGQTTIGRNLYPKAPDLRRAETQNLRDGQIYYVIHNGVRLSGMPAWGKTDSDVESWRLVHFIRYLPKITAEELRAMERLNPKSPPILGTVTNVTDTAFTVQTIANQTRTITINAQTMIMKGDAHATIKDVKVGDRVVIDVDKKTSAATEVKLGTASAKAPAAKTDAHPHK